jgi:hypothetical protein
LYTSALTSTKPLGDLVEALIVAFNNIGIKARHITTTYSLANIAILIDCFEHGEDIHLRCLVEICS